MGRKTNQEQYYYNSVEYAEKKEQIAAEAEEIKKRKKEEALEKEKDTSKEVRRLKKIFSKERCGEENMHFVFSLIDRAAFLRIELEHIEKNLQSEGMMDFFIQGTQTMWREHPLSKVHVQHSKSYRETIKQLESYVKNDDGGEEEKNNPLIGLINRGNYSREKYKR